MKKIFLLVFCISLLTIGIISISCKNITGCICVFTESENSSPKTTIYSGDQVKASGSKNCDEYTIWMKEQLAIVKDGEISCHSNDD